MAARHHVAIHLDADASGPVDKLRSAWDPVMHAIAPAHVTVVYPEETVDTDLLLQRLEQLSAETTPFRLRLGAFDAADDGRGGVFALVDDPTGSLEAIRDRLLLPPQRFIGYPFHATIAHPRTAESPAACWLSVRGAAVNVAFTVPELLWTATDESTRRVLRRFPLGSRSTGRIAIAAGVLLDGERILLGLRRRDLAVAPGVWDLPGGHVEPGESPRAALRRELQEELGVDATLAGPWRRIVDDDHGIELSLWLVHDWHGTVTNQAVAEHDRLDWFTAAQLRTLPLAHPSYVPMLTSAMHGDHAG